MRRAIVWTAMISAAAAGCASNQATEKKLVDGKTAMEQQKFDSAVGSADAALAGSQSKVDSSAAYYLRGRAIEQRAKADPTASQADLSLAKGNYERALQLAPPKSLEGYIRTSLGNVDFFQGDYPGAAEQWSRAYPLLSEADLKAWTLYRIGLCQQRLGQFVEADKTFAGVQANFPGSEQASRAGERKGVKAFQVQLATFKTMHNADVAIAELRQQGISASRTMDTHGLSAVRVGPFPTYAAAQQVKDRFAGSYGDAIIVP